MSIFFIADLHFDDENIMNYESRPFSTAEEMNAAIIENWNRVVGKDDTVYLLGDIGNERYISELNGIKILVKGNHDMYDSNYYRNNGFTEVYDLPVILDGFWMLSHEPLYVNKNMPYANIYGHIHNNPNYNDYSSHGYCVSVERIGYKPVSFEKIKSDVGEAVKMEKLLELAIKVATEAHKDQVDKGGKPYIGHPTAVAASVNEPDQKIAAYLHDVIEDTPITADDLLRMGFTPKIVDSIKLLTKDKNVPYEEYLKNIRSDSVARAVKIADLKHNMDLSRIPNPTEKDYARLEKYKKALAFLEG